MPINRGPFNALTDDDGSNTVGSIWNKAAIQGVLLDPIDVALVPTPLTSTATGVQNALNPGIGEDTVIFWSGSADLTLNGLVGGANGRRLTIMNRAAGASMIYVNHNNSGAAAGTRFSNVATSGPTPLATGGSATWNFDPAYGGYWTLVAHEQGIWMTPAYSAANFTGGLVVDAGDVVTSKYRLNGRTLMYAYALNTITITGSPATVGVTNGQWGGFTAAGLFTSTIGYAHDGAVVPAYAQVVNSGTTITFTKTAGNWGNPVNGGFLQGTHIFEVT